MTDDPDRFRELAEASCRWVLDEVRGDDGPWIPTADADDAGAPPWDRDGMHSGIGGAAYLLAETRLSRAWTDEERRLAQAIAERLRRVIPTQTDATFFDGLPSTIGVLLALGEPGADLAVARLLELRTSDGWAQTTIGGPRYLPGARVNDLTLGTAGVLAAAIWALRHDVPGSALLAGAAADVLLTEAEETPTGLDWPFVPGRFVAEPPAGRMPNLSHGLAGIAAVLAVAGTELGRSDLVDAATAGATHLVSLGDTSAGGFVVPRTIPPAADLDEVTFTWCHGPAGTSLLFRALEHAGVESVVDEPPTEWHRRCLHSVRTSGIPERLHPGFWDNDGRCCGTAGVGDVFLDSWHHAAAGDDLGFALDLGDALVDRAIRDGDRACWRFLEHRNTEPLLPPGVGWMQGAAGISAYLFHLSRVVEHGTDAAPLPRLDSWWAV